MILLHGVVVYESTLCFENVTWGLLAAINSRSQSIEMGIPQNKSGRVSVKTRLRNTVNGQGARQPRNSSCTINLECDSKSSVKKRRDFESMEILSKKIREKNKVRNIFIVVFVKFFITSGFRSVNVCRLNINLVMYIIDYFDEIKKGDHNI